MNTLVFVFGTGIALALLVGGFAMFVLSAADAVNKLIKKFK